MGGVSPNITASISLISFSSPTGFRNVTKSPQIVIHRLPMHKTNCLPAKHNANNLLCLGVCLCAPCGNEFRLRGSNDAPNESPSKTWKYLWMQTMARLFTIATSIHITSLFFNHNTQYGRRQTSAIGIGQLCNSNVGLKMWCLFCKHVMSWQWNVILSANLWQHLDNTQ